MLTENEYASVESRVPSKKTKMIADSLTVKEIEKTITVTPVSGKGLSSMADNKFCENLSQPHFFPTRNNGYQVVFASRIYDSTFKRFVLFHYKKGQSLSFSYSTCKDKNLSK